MIVCILAFVGLAGLNFTQSESSFISKSLASSGSSSSGTSSSTATYPKVCKEDECEITVGVAPLTETFHGTVEKCFASNDPRGAGGEPAKNCDECHSCDALDGTCWDPSTWL